MDMLKIRRAVGLYFQIIFVLGFILGAIRVALVAPRIGDLAAVCIEVPLMLVASWFVSRWVITRTELPREIGPLLAVGLLSFLFLMIGEYVLASFIFHHTLDDYLAGFRTTAGSIGLAGQIAFGLMPLVHRKA